MKNSRKLAQRLPLQVTAITLSFATLGNIFSGVPNIRLIFGIVACLLFVLSICRICSDIPLYKKEMQNPVMASTFSTFFMSMIVLSTYIKSYSSLVAIIFWFLGIILYIIYLVYIVSKIILPTKKILPSHYVTFVGLAVASVTSPMFEMQALGKVIAIICLAFFVILTPLIFRNLFKRDYIPTAALPTKVIVGAPLSLSLLGYLNTFGADNTALIGIMMCVAFLLTLLAIYFLCTSLSKKFNAAYAAYTFPMVISSFCMQAISKKTIFGFTKWVYLVELCIALVVTIGVFVVYAIHFFKDLNSDKNQNASKVANK